MIYFKVPNTMLGKAIAKDLKELGAEELTVKKFFKVKEKDIVFAYKPKLRDLVFISMLNAKKVFYASKVKGLGVNIDPLSPRPVLPNPLPLKGGDKLCLSPLSDDIKSSARVLHFLRSLGYDVYVTSENPLLSSLVKVEKVGLEECGGFLAFYNTCNAENVFEAFTLAQVGLVAKGPKIMTKALSELAPCIKWINSWRESLEKSDEIKGCGVKGNLIHFLSSLTTT